MKRTDAEKLLHAIDVERRAQTRVKRAATILSKRSAMRRRIEKRIGEAEVQRIVQEHEAKWIARARQNQTKKIASRLMGGTI